MMAPPVLVQEEKEEEKEEEGKKGWGAEPPPPPSSLVWAEWVMDVAVCLLADRKAGWGKRGGREGVSSKSPKRAKGPCSAVKKRV